MSYDVIFCTVHGGASLASIGCDACKRERTREIERLRSSLEDSQGESERLTAELEQYQRKALDLKFDNIEKGGRIEELERDRERGLEERGYLIIDKKRIDAAWAVAPDAHGATGRVVEKIFHELNIVACEECGGSGEYVAATDPDGRQWPDCCPTCHGHRWKKT